MPHKIASQWKMEGKKIGTWRERRTNKTYRREQTEAWKSKERKE